MKAKRIFAWIGIVLLVALYIITLISACIQAPFARQLFYASLFATIVVPIFIYVMQMIVKYLTSNNDTNI